MEHYWHLRGFGNELAKCARGLSENAFSYLILLFEEKLDQSKPTCTSGIIVGVRFQA